MTQSPNGSQEPHDERLAQAIRQSARQTHPDPAFVARLEAHLLDQFAPPRPPALPETQTEEADIVNIAHPQPARHRRDTFLIPLPFAAAITALIALAALITLSMLYMNTSPPEGAGSSSGALIQSGDATPTPNITQTLDSIISTAVEGTAQANTAAQTQASLEAVQMTAAHIIMEATDRAANVIPVVTAAPLPNLPVIVESVPQHGVDLGGWASDYSAHTVSQMRSMGMTWVAAYLPFHLSDTGRVSDTFATAKVLISAAEANGFKIMLTLYGNPVEFGEDFDEYAALYASFASRVAALSPDAIQIWNEPNIDRNWTTGDIDPADYVTLLRASYRAIKIIDPNIMVITAAPAPTVAGDIFPGQIVNDDIYYQGMAEANAAAYADCIGVRYVEGIVPPDQTTGDSRDDLDIRYLVPMLRRATAPFADSGLPLCLTQFGYISPHDIFTIPALNTEALDVAQSFTWTSGTSVQDQALWISQAIPILAEISEPEVEMVLIYRVDPVGDPYSGMFAIIRAFGLCPTCDALSAAR